VVAPTVDTIALLPSLSLPLQGGDFAPTASTGDSALVFDKIPGSPPILFSRKWRTRADRREVIPWRGAKSLQHQSSIPVPHLPTLPPLRRQGSLPGSSRGPAVSNSVRSTPSGSKPRPTASIPTSSANSATTESWLLNIKAKTGGATTTQRKSAILATSGLNAPTVIVFS
jgi:hypothetical protein